MHPLFEKRAVSGGALQVRLRTSAIAASLMNGQGKTGWSMDDDGIPYIETADVAATAVRLNGFAFTPDGAMYVTSDVPSSTSTRMGGFAVSVNGALHYTETASSASLVTGGIALTADGRVLLGYEAPIFKLNLADLGAGVVDTTPQVSAGSATATFTRATTAYARLSTGVWGLVASGSPRSMYSVTGAYLGYWAEGARADVLGTTAAIRRTMTDAGWVVGATMTVGSATGIDGVATAGASLTGGAVSATNTILFTTVLGSAARTFSAFVRRKTGSGTVNMTDNGGTNWTDITALIGASGGLALQVQVTRTQANPVVGFQVVTNGDAIEVDFNTIEAATFANPTPIPVNVSKAADVLTFPTSGNIADAAGTAYCEFSLPSWPTYGSQGQILSVPGVSGWIRTNSTNVISSNDGANTASGPINVPAAGSVAKAAASWTGSVLACYAQGSAGTPGTYDGSFNDVGTMTIGNSPFGGTKNIRIYNRAMSAAQLQALTT